MNPIHWRCGVNFNTYYQYNTNTNVHKFMLIYTQVHTYINTYTYYTVKNKV